MRYMIKKNKKSKKKKIVINKPSRHLIVNSTVYILKYRTLKTTENKYLAWVVLIIVITYIRYHESDD